MVIGKVSHLMIFDKCTYLFDYTFKLDITLVPKSSLTQCQTPFLGVGIYISLLSLLSLTSSLVTVFCQYVR